MEEYYQPNKKNKKNDINLLELNELEPDINQKINSILLLVYQMNSKILVLEQQVNIILLNQQQFINSKRKYDEESNEIFNSYIN